MNRNHLHDAARNWMLKERGAPKDMETEEKQRFYEDLGLLAHFISDLAMEELQLALNA